MKIKIVFVIVAAIALILGGTVGGIVSHKITRKADRESHAEIVKIYQTQNAECRTDRNELASKARFLISQKLYVRKVKNGQVSYDPQSTMEISKFIDTIDSLDMKLDSVPFIPLDSIKPRKTFWDKIKFW